MTSSLFLKNTTNIAIVEAIELYHPDFGYLRYQSYDVDETILLTHDSIEHEYQYESFELSKGNTTSDLDQAVSITFADYKDELMQAIESANHEIAIEFRLREYRSDDFSEPFNSLQTLSVLSVSSDDSGMVTFDANAEQLNNVKTGDVYTLEKFPTLKGAV